VEAAFISNPEEEKKLASPVFQQNVADGVAKAIVAYFGRRRTAAAPTSAVTPPAPPSPSAAPARTR
jgi:hypothetical protein